MPPATKAPGREEALESKIIADYDDPELGRFRGPGINTRLSATPGSVPWNSKKSVGSARTSKMRSKRGFDSLVTTGPGTADRRRVLAGQ